MTDRILPMAFTSQSRPRPQSPLSLDKQVLIARSRHMRASGKFMGNSKFSTSKEVLCGKQHIR